MIFSKEKRILLKDQRGRGLSTFLFGLFAAAAMFVPFMISDNGYFTFYGDFNVQQIPFYQSCHAAVRSGQLSWSFITDLGSPFIGSYSFYLLGSPFFWLTLPFPNSFVPYLMGPLLILKFALAALTGYLFIKRFTRTAAAAQIGGLLYAFSGFSVYNIFFNHFHEAIIIFPLLLLSMELLITENRRGLFCLTVALAAISNYFFFFGMAVFCIIYFVIRLSCHAYHLTVWRFSALAFEAVLGVLLATFILIPSILTVLSNGRVSQFQMGWGGIMYSSEQRYLNIIECFFFPPDLPSRPVFFPSANAKWSSLGGWLPLFGMCGALGFVLSKKGSFIKRVICTSAFCAMVPVLNSAFYAFNSSYYARWFYMPILFICLATAISAEDETVDLKRGFRLSAIITVAIAAVIGLFPQKKDGKIVFGLYTDAGNRESYAYKRFIIAVVIAISALIVLRLVMLLKKTSLKAFFNTSVALVLVFSVIYGTVFIYGGKTHSHTKRAMIDSLIEGDVTLPDKQLKGYRIDTYGCADNTGMYLELPTINAFHSVVSTSIMDFYTFIGQKRDVASRPTTDCYSIRSLLSVRYLLNHIDGNSFIDENGETYMPGFKYITSENGYDIYENENYIPYGFSYKYYMAESECALLYKNNDRANIMLKAIVLPDEIAKNYSGNMLHFSEYIDSAPTAPAVKDEAAEDIPSQTQSSNAEDGSVADSSAIDGSSSENTSSENTSSESTSGEELGFDGMDAALSFTTEDAVWGLNSDLSYEALSLDAKELKKSGATFVKADDGKFTAHLTRDQSNLAFFSIPYEEGWSVTVNGKKAEIIKANIGFMAVEVPAGNSEVVFTYRTPNLNIAIIVSLSALLVLVLYLAGSLAFKKLHPIKENYPEGERLLAEWGALLEQSACDEEYNGYLDPVAPEEIPMSKYSDGFTVTFDDYEEPIDNQNKE